jgi:voltage-gated potassium channel
MYLVEGPEHGFTSIPRGIYWAIVTLTTVGYGDITPQTIFGQTLSSVIMILGYSIIAVPTGIVTAEMTKKNVQTNTNHCPNCNEAYHDDDAKYCKRCGSLL